LSTFPKNLSFEPVFQKNSNINDCPEPAQQLKDLQACEAHNFGFFLENDFFLFNIYILFIPLMNNLFRGSMAEPSCLPRTTPVSVMDFNFSAPNKISMRCPTNLASSFLSFGMIRSSSSCVLVKIIPFGYIYVPSS
jgi:hypothetical protein